MTKFTAGQFMISSNGSYEWTATSAKTLRGAKMLASKMFQTSFDGQIKVGIARDSASVDMIAIKRGFGTWTE